MARQIGLVPSALYRHFKGKEEMVDAALEIIRRRLLRQFGRRLEETEAPLDGCGSLGRHLEMIRDNQAIPRIIFSEEVYAEHPNRKKKVYHLVRTFLSRVEAIVRVGRKAGQIREDFEPEMISVLFLGLFQPAAVLWYLSDGRYDISRHIHRAWPIFKDAIKGNNRTIPQGDRCGQTKERKNSMKNKKFFPWIMFLSMLCGGVVLLLPSLGAAHCDTLAGPVVQDTKAALERGDVTPVLK